MIAHQLKNCMNNATPPEHPSLAELINQVAYRIRFDLNQRLHQHGLDITVWPILHCLWQKDGIPQAHISKALGRPDYVTSRAIDRLEASGLVLRQQDPDNRRVRLIFLTAAGRTSQDDLAPLTDSTHEKVLGQLSLDEQSQLMSLLRKIIQIL